MVFIFIWPNTSLYSSGQTRQCTYWGEQFKKLPMSCQYTLAILINELHKKKFNKDEAHIYMFRLYMYLLYYSLMLHLFPDYTWGNAKFNLICSLKSLCLVGITTTPSSSWLLYTYCYSFIETLLAVWKLLCGWICIMVPCTTTMISENERQRPTAFEYPHPVTSPPNGKVLVLEPNSTGNWN